MRMFRNDYSEGAAAPILEALTSSNFEQHAGYTEEDVWCERARELIREACGRNDVSVEFAIGGTSANLVCLNGLLHDWEGVICTPDAHINVHETGAIAATGRTVLPTRDNDGFLSVAEAERVWQFQTAIGRHMTRPGAVYITHATELGGIWSKQAFVDICDWADEHGLPVFVDGARMAAALTASGADLDLATIAQRAAAFYLGGTKNGLLFGEAVVISHAGLKEAFPYLIKERGGLMAKGRLLGVQFARAFEPQAGSEPLWFSLARTANTQAQRLREGLIKLGYEPYGVSPTNQQFFVVSPQQEQAFMQACGCETFYVLENGRRVIRFVCSWSTQDTDVDELLAFAAQQQ